MSAHAQTLKATPPQDLTALRKDIEDLKKTYDADAERPCGGGEAQRQ